MSIFTNINNHIDIELRKRVVKYINMLADTNTDINNLQIQFCINKKYIKTSGNLLYSLKRNPYIIKVPGCKYNVPDMTLMIYPEYEKFSMELTQPCFNDEFIAYRMEFQHNIKDAYGFSEYEWLYTYHDLKFKNLI